MSRKNSKLQATANKEVVRAERIARFLAKMPSDKFLQVIETHEQLKRWAVQRQDNDWISKCFVARIVGGDPLRPLLKAKEIDKWLYEFLWNTANFYYSLWDLIQFTINEIKEYFINVIKIEFRFRSTLELFLDIVEIQESNEYSVWLKSYHKVSTPDLLEAATLTRKNVWTKDTGGLTQHERAKVDRFLTSYPKNFLLKVVWGICLHHSKSNEQIKERVDSVMRTVTKTADLHAVGCRKRESATFQKYRSFEIQKGEVLYAKRHGGCYT